MAHRALARIRRPRDPEQGRAVSVLKLARAATMASFARKPVHLIAKLIGRSPIETRGLLPGASCRASAVLVLPAGYEAVDLFILQWIAAETLRSRRNYLPL